jgi:hypothetical protein
MSRFKALNARQTAQRKTYYNGMGVPAAPLKAMQGLKDHVRGKPSIEDGIE